MRKLIERLEEQIKDKSKVSFIDFGDESGKMADFASAMKKAGFKMDVDFGGARKWVGPEAGRGMIIAVDSKLINKASSRRVIEKLMKKYGGKFKSVVSRQAGDRLNANEIFDEYMKWSVKKPKTTKNEDGGATIEYHFDIPHSYFGEKPSNKDISDLFKPMETRGQVSPGAGFARVYIPQIKHGKDSTRVKVEYDWAYNV